LERTIPVGILDARSNRERQQSASRAAAARSSAPAEPELPNENGAPAVPPASGSGELVRETPVVGGRAGTADGPAIPANECDWMPGAAGAIRKDCDPERRTLLRAIPAACPRATLTAAAWSRPEPTVAGCRGMVERAGVELTRWCRSPVPDRLGRGTPDRRAGRLGVSARGRRSEAGEEDGAVV